MRKNIILLIVLIVVPYVFCCLLDLFSDKVDIGQGGASIEQHLMGKNVQIELDGLYKTMDVEEYILGVLPGTISADYDLETLKVQAILIRTNVLKEMEEKGSSDAADLSYQYLSVEERIALFGERNYERYERQFEQAIVETAGIVLRQEGALIMALYHEVSIGKTVSAAEILGEDIAYLQSVESSQDVEAKHYMNVVSYTWEEFLELEKGVVTTIETSSETEATPTTQASSETEATPTTQASSETEVTSTTQATPATETVPKVVVEIKESTENGFVKQLSVDGTIYTGDEAVERYGLSSANFYVEEVEGGIRFVCLGKGSCMGLSQYGANCMALKGKSANDIIKYYYSNVSVEEYKIEAK